MKVRLKPRSFRAALARRNLTLASFARRVPTSPAYLSQLMAGTRCPSPTMRERMLRALEGCRFEDLFALVEDRRAGNRLASVGEQRAAAGG